MTEQPTVTPRTRAVGRGIMLLAVLFLAWFVFLRSPGDGTTSPPERRTAASYVEEFGGDTGRYEAILRWTDCTALDRAFQDGKANFDANAPGGRDQWRGQMAVTDDRMRALGCP